MEKAAQDQLCEPMDIDSDEGGALSTSTPAVETEELMENPVDE